jgi:FemAB-related protein (PEP-CTERM system-associated)
MSATAGTHGTAIRGATALAAIPAAPAPITIEAVTPDAAWDRYVDGHPDGCAAHLSAWSGIVARAFGKSSRYLTAKSAGEIVGVLPLVYFDGRLFTRCTVSMPFLNYGGVLADSQEIERALVGAGIEEARRHQSRYLELRHVHRRFDDLPNRSHKVAMRLELARDPDAQWAALDRKVRNQVRKAQKSDLTVRTGGVELLDAFYAVFSRNMRDLGTPVYPKRFFGEILASLSSQSALFTVWLGERPVAASIVLWHRDVLEVPSASSLREFNRLCPNMLLYWEMVKFGIERGFATFDFGRSTPDEGTYDFKRQWGAAPQPLHWEYWLSPDMHGTLPDVSPKNPRYRRAIEAWQRLPLVVANALGPMLVRHIP